MPGQGDELKQFLLDITSQLEVLLLGTLLVVLALWLLRRLAFFIIKQRAQDPQIRYRWHKNVTYVSIAVGVVILGWLWLRNTQSLATFFGLISAGLAIALQEPLTNFVGWLVIKLGHLFEFGDRIQIGTYAGDVVDIRIQAFTLVEIGNWVDADQSTGRVIHIPNGWIFKESVANYHKGLGYIWHEIPVHITFESNWEKAQCILQDIADNRVLHFAEQAEARLQRTRPRYTIVYTNLTPLVYMRGEQNGILLTVRYLCNPRQRRATEQSIWEDILHTFSQAPDIAFAYPTWRLYNPSVITE